MPLYDYKCPDCSAEVEAEHRMSESPEIICKECGGTMKKIIKTAPGVKFKGKGWYATDGKLDELIKKEPPIGHPDEWKM